MFRLFNCFNKSFLLEIVTNTINIIYMKLRKYKNCTNFNRLKMNSLKTTGSSHFLPRCYFSLSSIVYEVKVIFWKWCLILILLRTTKKKLQMNENWWHTILDTITMIQTPYFAPINACPKILSATQSINIFCSTKTPF